MIRDISAIRSANHKVQSSKFKPQSSNLKVQREKSSKGKEFNAQSSKGKEFTNKKAAPTNGCRIRDSPPPLIRREERPQGVINMLASKSEGLPTSVLPPCK